MWKTFWLEDTGRARRGLRRYVHLAGHRNIWTCEGGWHSGFRWTGEEVAARLTPEGLHRSEWDGPPHDDPAWPSECDGCSYRFAEEDEWQTWAERLWFRADTGELRVLHWSLAPQGAPVAEPGATWDAKWMGTAGPDGICLMVRCPRGDGSKGLCLDWCVDMPSTRSSRVWARSGDPRLAEVTVSPSVEIGTPGQPGYYHGWLHEGVLTDHMG